MARRYKSSNSKRDKTINRLYQSGKNRRVPTKLALSLQVEIKEEAIKQLESYRQFEGNEESGVFTGSIINDDRVRICKVSESCSIRTKSSKHGCIRDSEKANSFIENDFNQSNHSRYYLGEWHTHHENDPHPSTTDRDSIIKIYRESTIVIDGVFLIIIGLKSNYYEFYDGNIFHPVSIIIV